MLLTTKPTPRKRLNALGHIHSSTHFKTVIFILKGRWQKHCKRCTVDAAEEFAGWTQHEHSGWMLGSLRGTNALGPIHSATSFKTVIYVSDTFRQKHCERHRDAAEEQVGWTQRKGLNPKQTQVLRSWLCSKAFATSHPWSIVVVVVSWMAKGLRRKGNHCDPVRLHWQGQMHPGCSAWPVKRCENTASQPLNAVLKTWQTLDRQIH